MYLLLSYGFVAPHQPRLDWQMWFAALGQHQNNPWLLNFVYRLLTGQAEVLQLIDQTRLPFQKPPKYIRAQLYKYHYTKPHQGKNWWTRTLDKQYLPPATK